MLLNCCARKIPSEKQQSQGNSTRTRLPWEAEPEKFNREAKSSPSLVPKFENKAAQGKKPLDIEAGQKAKQNVPGLEKTESALLETTSHIAKAKKSVMEAKEEMENLRRKQTELTKSLVEQEKQASSQGNDFMSSFFGSINPSKFASTLIIQVTSACRDVRKTDFSCLKLSCGRRTWPRGWSRTSPRTRMTQPRSSPTSSKTTAACDRPRSVSRSENKY
jgi:hypothetical protein